MVTKREKSCQSPCFNVHVELDNRALKAKNNGLTQTVAKLQQENAELSKQVTLLQGESFEIKSRYNNLRNVISIIDSTTKTCLPKLNEVVETFTGIIHLCSVAANISNSNRDTRTQAVKPQIVNGHVLHNPTITLSRLNNDNASYTPPRPSTSRISSNVTIRPSTSEVRQDRNSNLNGDQGEDDESDHNENESNEDMVEDTSFICRANRGVCKRKKSIANEARFQEDDSEDSDEEFEMPLAEEETNEEDQSDQRLTTIQEGEEEEEEEDSEVSGPLSPRSRQRRFLKGRLQEVRIYLNQLPITSVEQFRGSGNISISLAPPERRSSYKQRSSSLVGELNGSLVDNSCSFLDENMSLLSTVRMSQENFKVEESSSLDSRPRLSVTFKGSSSKKSPSYQESSCASSSDGTLQFSSNLSPIRTSPAATRSTSNTNSASMSSLTLQEFSMAPSDDSHRKTSTPIVPRKSSENFNRSISLNKISKSDASITFKSNVTKRRVTSREKKKVAHVLLDQLSTGKRLSGSPPKAIKDIVKSPLLTKPSEMRTRSKGKIKANSMTFEEENVEHNPIENVRTSTRWKKDSELIRKIKKEPLVKPIVKTPPKKSPIGRPRRAARPTILKEPNLNKKMRRSK